MEPWEAAEIEAELKKLCDDLGEKPRAVYLPIRVAVTGSRVSPGLYESLELLGKELSLARIRAGLQATVSDIAELVGSSSVHRVARSLAGADRRLRGGDRRPAVIHGSRPRGRRAVRDHGRARAPTLSLCVPMLSEVLPPAGTARQLRRPSRPVPAPVSSGSRIRGRFRIASVEQTRLGERAVIEATVECEGVGKPVCVAELIVLTLP